MRGKFTSKFRSVSFDAFEFQVLFPGFLFFFCQSHRSPKAGTQNKKRAAEVRICLVFRKNKILKLAINEFVMNISVF